MTRHDMVAALERAAILVAVHAKSADTADYAILRALVDALRDSRARDAFIAAVTEEGVLVTGWWIPEPKLKP